MLHRTSRITGDLTLKQICFFFILMLFPLLIQSQVTFSPGDLDLISKSDRDAHAGLAGLYGKTSPAISYGYDARYYRCFWNVDPAFRAISGNVTMHFNTGSVSIDTLLVNLDQNIITDSVFFRGQPAGWLHNSDLLKVILPASLQASSFDSVTIYYHGIPVENSWEYFDQRTHNNIPVISTMSQPYGSSSWWPCKDDLTGKADSVDVFIRVPAAYRAVSNGILMSETQAGSAKVFHWKHRYPIATYLVCLAVTNYARYEHQVIYNNDTLPVVNYIYPEDSAAVWPQTAQVVPMIKLFDSLFGIYPFQREQYGHTQFRNGGGMEHQTMTFVGTFGFELLAHELAHQWFGDMVTCGSWADIWLNEGYATYLSGLCYEFLAPEWWSRFKEVRISYITSKPGGSVYCTDTNDVGRLFDGRLTYAKGGMILHQLRWITGDSVFFAATNNYLYDIMLSYKFSRTADLKKHFEQSFGSDLTYYFDNWYTGEGYPMYHINWSQEAGRVRLTVNQTQSHPSVSFFRLPLELLLRGSGRDTLIRINNTFSGESFAIDVPFSVDSIIFDPNFRIISRNNTVNAVAEKTLQMDLQIFPNPAGDVLTVVMESSRRAEYTISGLDGKIINTGEVNDRQSTISVKSLPAGCYILKVRNDGQTAIRKFTKAPSN